MKKTHIATVRKWGFQVKRPLNLNYLVLIADLIQSLVGTVKVTAGSVSKLLTISTEMFLYSFSALIFLFLTRQSRGEF